ncbi:MAG: sialidase family protein [bacterium]|jgi:hypothetical protein|nr:sialidase family protein [bacterium]
MNNLKKVSIFLLLSIALILGAYFVLSLNIFENGEVANDVGQVVAEPVTIHQELPPDRSPEGVHVSGADGDELNGPYWQNLVVSTSNDSEAWGDSVTIVEHASGPDALVLHSDIGDYGHDDVLLVMTYFPENLVGAGELSMMRSSDNAASWSEPVELTLEGAGEQIPVDPSIYQLEDGRLLLLYQDLRESNDQHETHTFYIALSSDGSLFTYEGDIFSTTDFAIHPDLIEYEGEWHLFYAIDSEGEGIYMATSDVYTTFSDAQSVGVGGIPGTVIVDGELVLYGCDLDGMPVATYQGGILFEETAKLRIGGCAPSPVLMSNGEIAIVRTDHTASE